MKQYKVIVDFGRGPFVRYISAQDEEAAAIYCSLVADLAPFSDVSFEEVTDNG